MDAHFNDSEVQNSIMEVLAEQRAIRHKLMTALQLFRETADRSALGVNATERALWQTLYVTSNYTCEGVEHGHSGNTAKSN